MQFYSRKMLKGGDASDSESEASVEGGFLTRGAFLLTPSHDLNMDKASGILEKMNFRGPFSLTKTATGILFKFSDPEDYQATYKKGFHKVTGARFYKKVPIPCRPQKTFVVFVLEVPEDLPEEDIRHSLYKYNSIVEVTRLPAAYFQQQQSQGQQSATGSSGRLEVAKSDGSYTTPVVRVTLASMDEAHNLLQNGLDFYGATFFPTELGDSSHLTKVPQSRKHQTLSRWMMEGGSRVKELLPVFDASGFAKIPPPPSKTVKPKP